MIEIATAMSMQSIANRNSGSKLSITCAFAVSCFTVKLAALPVPSPLGDWIPNLIEFASEPLEGRIVARSSASLDAAIAIGGWKAK
jgi:hypothetical protein